MPKLPVLSGKQLLKLLQKNGFSVVRQKGSHVFVENKDGELTTVIPLHGNEDLGKGLLKAILNDLELPVEELVDMLK
jgi:predicted RNA binding protein YcfA (HicA-like mRNA interferase family)